MFAYKNLTEAYKVQNGDSIFPESKMINPNGKILFTVQSLERVGTDILFKLTAKGSAFIFPYKAPALSTVKGVFAVNN